MRSLRRFSQFVSFRKEAIKSTKPLPKLPGRLRSCTQPAQIETRSRCLQVFLRGVAELARNNPVLEREILRFLEPTKADLDFCSTDGHGTSFEDLSSKGMASPTFDISNNVGDVRRLDTSSVEKIMQSKNTYIRQYSPHDLRQSINIARFIPLGQDRAWALVRWRACRRD